MVSFKLRKVFYGAAAGAEEILNKKRQKIMELEELEKQVRFAKKLLNKIENEEDYDAAAVIRMEGKLKKLEAHIKQHKTALMYY
ncbi:MAG: hypothetical protein ACP5N3_03980 [Candidatus Nanoarchaeia archaeon]